MQDTDNTEITEFSVKNGKKIRPIRETCAEPAEVSVSKRFLNSDFEKTMETLLAWGHVTK